ncbi:MAG: hypothetical protein LUI39_07335 [Lachnospiraceae bacterium]|nr:hypothetical protein [Lachnospiraceae bacterium]
MKKILIPIIIVALLAAALYFVPFPARINAELSGWEMNTADEVAADGITVMLNGWRLRYLFKQDIVTGTLSLHYENQQDSDTEWKLDGPLYIHFKDGYHYTGSVYSAKEDEYTILNLVVSRSWDAIKIEWESLDGYWLAGELTDPEAVRSALDA